MVFIILQKKAFVITSPQESFDMLKDIGIKTSKLIDKNTPERDWRSPISLGLFVILTRLNPYITL